MTAVATISHSDGLAFLENARTALANASTVDEARGLLDQAEQLQFYAKQQRLSFDLQNRAAELKLRAEVRVGELLTSDDAVGRGKPNRLSGLGIAYHQSSRWQRLAALPVDVLEDYIADTVGAGRELTTSGALKLAKQSHSAAPVSPLRVVVPLPEGVFPTITADPPWRYGNTSTRGAAQDHYDTMSIEELCDLDVVREKAADQSHLYLWATAGHLPEAFKVMEAWGFTYKTYLVWVKPQMGMGNYFRVSTELVLFGTRGDLGTNSKSIMNYFQAPRGKHSAKPQVFHEIVERSSPGPYLELFSRCHAEDVLTGCTCSKCRLGWSVWGNQS